MSAPGNIQQSTTTRADWETPGWLFRWLDHEFGPFDLDAAANASNYKCERWLGPGGAGSDALQTNWAIEGFRIFCNPPYGAGLDLWVQQAIEAGNGCSRATLLVPDHTSAKWWHQAFREASLVVNFEGRVSFEFEGKPQSGNTSGSNVFVFDGLGGPPRVRCESVAALRKEWDK